MAPKTKFTRAEMTVAALQIVRERGVSALTARSVAEVLRVSTQPVFTCFHSMEELRREVLSAAREIYDGYIQEGLSAEIPFYGVGMAYIRFARTEPELYRLLFLTAPTPIGITHTVDAFLKQNQYGFMGLLNMF